MKAYITPKIDIYTIKIEEAIANSSAITKPMSSNDTKDEWEIGTNVEKNFTWE